MKFITTLSNKEIVYTPYIRHHLGKFKEGQKIIVEIEKPRNTRSLNQNRYYWLCLGLISGHTGHDTDELHRLFRGMFLPKKEITLNKKKYFLPVSTTDLTKGEFVEYMMKIEAESGQMGIKLPSPKEYQAGLDESVLVTK